MIEEVLLVHHSHTDIGYTHPQPVVFELHDRFIESALDLADATIDERDDARFRWTCEVTGITRAWWERASNGDRDRFLAAAKRGQMEVAALEWHLTPLADLRMLIRSLENVRFFRALGVPVRSAMNTDVNGVPWGLVDVLLDHGIDGFSMAINSHLGGAVSPRPGAFKWAAPDGRELLVWNGFQYWHAANVLMGMPSSVEAVAKAMPPFLAETERCGYPLPYLPVQITNPHHPDNAAPDATLSAFVREWNDRDPAVRIRTVLLTEVFDRLRGEDLPRASGDWTDYWNLGAGSSVRETTVLMEGLRTLDAAYSAAAFPLPPEKREREHLDAAHAGLALYAEHTWGADCSITQPESIETRMQWATKSAYAYQGLGHARIVLRDALHRLAGEAGGEEPTFLLYNPLSVPFKGPIQLPVAGLEWPLTPGVHHRQRLDGALGNIGEEAQRWCHVDLPALGYRTYPVAQLEFASDAGLSIRTLSTSGGRGQREGGGNDNPPTVTLVSSRVELQFNDATGGVQSLRIDGDEYVGEVEGLTFGVPILERPSGGSRHDIMQLHFDQYDLADGWKRDWPRDTFPGRLTGHSSRTVEGAVEHRQTFAMENGDRVEVVYRLFDDDPSVEVEAILDSAGDAKPYSLALPFTLPESGPTTWHFDTAGALVEFDREQLPNAARHYVTARRFVRMATEEAALSIATPDLPLWKFGGMFFAPSDQLDPAARRPVILGWLSNNYWEVNFLANQTGQTRYRLRLMPHGPERVADSYFRALPHTVPPRVHAYRDRGPVKRTQERLLRLEGEGVVLESIEREGLATVLVFQNLLETSQTVMLRPESLRWERAELATLDGTPRKALSRTSDRGWRVELPARALVGVRLE
ncbi:hypothetical protein BH11ARM2_BH11ARM2_08240 [soil metagenome]